LIAHPAAGRFFQDHLEHQALLERAYFHEIHACVRARLWGQQDNGRFVLPQRGVAEESVNRARADYNALYDQVDPARFSRPVRVWRRLRRSDSKDGSGRLRSAASQGLRRVDNIEAGERCQFCR
jgi:hypothetical protein